MLNIAFLQLIKITSDFLHNVPILRGKKLRSLSYRCGRQTRWQVVRIEFVGVVKDYRKIFVLKKSAQKLMMKGKYLAQ